MTLICLTGSTGFVGRAVTRALAARDVTLRHVIREGTQARIAVLRPQDEIVVVDDIFSQSAAWWHPVLAGSDIVLHLAWYADPADYQVSPRNLACLAGTMQMAQAAIETGVARFVATGTCLEYDLTQPRLHADCPLDPKSPYAAAKAACCMALAGMLPKAGVEFLWARLFYLHGAEEDPRRLTAYLHNQLAAGQPAQLTDGTQIRDYLSVEEAAALLVAETLSGRTGRVNIASGRGVTVREFATRIADGYGRRDLLQFGARPNHPDDPPRVVGIR